MSFSVEVESSLIFGNYSWCSNIDVPIRHPLSTKGIPTTMLFLKFKFTNNSQVDIIRVFHNNFNIRYSDHDMKSVNDVTLIIPYDKYSLFRRYFGYPLRFC